ncbi:MAG: hypothetical protein JSV91_16065 [Phycisphaerales bacterium]|nr:MAG: hypothetical protein JSV91_16065 [Phycisphaerales bacterium]
MPPMRWAVDLAYLAVALISLPIWLTRMIRTGKIRTDWAGRFGATPPAVVDQRSSVLLQAVSVGEVNAIRLLVDRLADPSHQAEGREPPRIIVSTTTDTGFERAKRLFGDRHRVVRYPLDFSFAVRRFLKAIRPNVAVLVELEVWPNFTAMCAKQGIRLCVVNGRLTERSARRYGPVRWMMRPSFRRLDRAAVQNEDYAARFRALGAENVWVTGTMKWDTAEIAQHVSGAEELARTMGIDRTRLLVVAGSTAPGEHELLARAVDPEVQLLCAPRKPEWFDQAASALPGCARRSRGDCGSKTGRFLLDTIGELRMAYALADVVVVGRSFGQLHGSDMMEPAALGKAVVVGPAVSDFQQTVDALLAGDGMVQTDRDRLPEVLRDLLNDPGRREELARNGQAVILAHQGATDRHVEIILSLLREGKGA